MERLGYTRLYATVTGTMLVLAGLFGFLASSEFKTPYLTDEMLGFLAVNGWANSFRIVLGLLGLVMATRFSRLYAAFAGVLLLALGIWGALAPNGQLLFDKLPAGHAANLINVVLGLLGLIAVVAVHSDGMTKRFRQRLERRRRHRLANRRRRRLRKAEAAKRKPAREKKPAAPEGSTAKDSPKKAGAPAAGKSQRPDRERTPSDSARKREDG